MASSFSDEEVRQGPTISSHQLAAATTPGLPTTELLGNFADLGRLFDQFEEPVLIELGNPLPKPKYMPRRRVGSCPAAHNDALLGNHD
ncbi:MAG TPA: hypothetical protein VFW35_07950 [Sphingomicrobium sp.]|nr:hypothetical protein [Sphingomicrobium sp.]